MLSYKTKPLTTTVGRHRHKHTPDKISYNKYFDKLKQQYLNTLRVSVVFDPVIGNRPWAYKEDGQFKGAAIDIIKAVAQEIPNVDKIIIYPKQTALEAQQSVVAGNDPVLAIPVPITKQAMLNDVGFVAFDTQQCNEQYLAYLSSDIECSIAEIVSGTGDPLRAIALATNCPNRRVIITEGNVVGLTTLENAGIPVESNIVSLRPTIQTTQELTGVLGNDVNLAVLLPCPVTNNLFNILGVTVTKITIEPFINRKLIFRDVSGDVPCSIKDAVNSNPTNPLAGIAERSTIDEPINVQVLENDGAALDILSLTGVALIISNFLGGVDITPESLTLLANNAALFVSDLIINQGLRALLSINGYAVIRITTNSEPGWLIYRVTTDPKSVSVRYDPLETIETSENNPPGCFLNVSVFDNDTAAINYLANYQEPFGDIPYTSAGFPPVTLIAFLNLLSNLSVNNSLLVSELFFEEDFIQFIPFQYQVITIQADNGPGEPSIYLFYKQETNLTCSILFTINKVFPIALTPTFSGCSLAVLVQANDITVIDLLKKAGVNVFIVDELNFNNLNKSIIPGNPIVGALLPFGAEEPSGFSSVDIIEPTPLPDDSAVLGTGIAIYRPAFKTELLIQYIVDKLICNGTIQEILAFYGLTTETLPENSLIPPLQLPPKYYSLEQGFIPQVAPYEVFLPKPFDDECVDNKRCIDIELAPKICV